MISSILPLIIFISCLCAATFVVNVTQSSYQAEENHNIFLEWIFTTNSDGSWKNLFIICELFTPTRAFFLYEVHEGVEVSGSQDEQFSGRVQSDKDVLREGRFRLHVSRLRTEDSGLYVCNIRIGNEVGFARCNVTVTASTSVQMRTTETVPHRNLITLPTSNSRRSREPLYCFIILFIMSLIALHL